MNRSTATHIPLLLLLVLAGLSALAPLSIDMYLPALPTMARDLGAQPAEGSLTVAAFFAGLCLGQLIHGPLSDRIGRRIPLLAGIAVYVIASAGAALSNSVEMLIAARLLQALGGCAGLVVSRALVRDRFPPQESAHVFSMLLLVMSLAPILAPLLGSWVLLVASWRALFWILTGFGILLALACFFRLEETRSAETAAHARSESPFAAYRILLTERSVMAYALTAGLAHMGLLTYLATSPDVLVTAFHLSPQTYGWVIAINGTGLITTNYLNRRLLAHFSYDRILRGATLGSLLASTVLLIDAATGFGGLWGITTPLFFMVAMIGFTQPNALAGAMAQDIHRAGSISALVGFLQFGAGALGATIAGWLHDGTALPMAGVIFTAYVLAVLALRLLGPQAAPAGAEFPR
ncbi:MAG TPA: multidrug effflux MFS transporter [Sphingomonadaceae bacterium]|nr:multidrug effflux MFS transporter [Sphingomonadaceae bacterium]